MSTILCKVIRIFLFQTIIKEDFSKNLSYKTFRSFFNINPAVYTQHCSGSGNTADSSCIAAIDKLVPEKKLASTLAQADSSQNIELIVKTN